MTWRRSLLSGATSVGARFAGSALQLVLNVVLARALGVAGIGAYYLFDAWHRTVAVAGSLGLPVATLRQTSQRFKSATSDDVWTATRQAVRVATVGASLALGVSVALGLVYGVLPTLVEGRAWSGWWIGAAAAGLVMLRIAVSALRGLLMASLANAIEFSVVPLVLILVVGGALMAGWSVSLTVVMVTYVATVVVAAGASFAVVRRRGTSDTTSEVEAVPPHDARWTSVRRLAPFWANATLQIAFASVPLLLVPVFGDVNDVGLFGVASRLVSVGGVFLSGLSSSLAPRMARSHARGDGRMAFRWLYLSQLLGLVTFLPLFAAYWWLTEPLLSIFGASYVDAAGLVKILAIGQLINVASGLVGPFASMTDRERWGATSQVVALAGFAVLVAWLGPRHGVIGVAIASSTAIAVRNLVLWVSCHAASLRRLVGT